MSKIALAPVVECPAQQFILERLEGPDFGGPPAGPGVYVVCMCKLGTPGPRKNPLKERVMYVGSSQNISKRTNNPTHPFTRLRDQYEWPWSVYLRTIECSDYVAKEIQLIRLFRPPMNYRHNG